MLHLKQIFDDIINEDESWWNALGPEGQKEYIKNHPNSKKAKDAKSKETDSKENTVINKNDKKILDSGITKLNKNIKLYHYTNDEPRISTEKRRFIPNSISLGKKGINSVFGHKKYEIQLPKDTKILKISKKQFSSLWSDERTPMDVGKILHDYAVKNNINVIYVENPAGMGDEFVVLDIKDMKFNEI